MRPDIYRKADGCRMFIFVKQVTLKASDYVTTVLILDSTRRRLKVASRKDQTYDDKINELLDLEKER